MNCSGLFIGAQAAKVNQRSQAVNFATLSDDKATAARCVYFDF